MENIFNEFKSDILKQEKEWVLITHRSCVDGIGVYLACYVYAKTHNLKLPSVITCEYSDKEILEYKQNVNSDPYNLKDTNVLIGDFSFPKDVLTALSYKVNNMVVFDHHKTAKDDLDGLEFCKFDMSKSGAMLVWEFLNGDKEIPSLIKYIEDRDIWKWELFRSKEVSAYLTLLSKKIGKNPEEDLKPWINLLEDENMMQETIYLGRHILDYQNQVIDSKVNGAKHQQPVMIDGVLVSCVNSTHLISEIGNKLAELNPYSAQYFFTETDIVFSLRSIGTIYDVSEICKRFGGGGHVNAAGFSIPLSVFDCNKFFRTRSLSSEDYKHLIKK